MRGRFAIALGLAWVAALCLGPLRALAESEEGRLTIRPRLGVTYEANDNAFLVRNGQGREWVHGLWIEPSIGLELRRPKWSAGADLGADLRYAFNESRLHNEFLDLSAYAEAEPLRGLHLRVANRLVPQAVSLGAPADDASNLRQSNLALAEVRYRHDRERGMALELGIAGQRFDTEGFPAQLDEDGDGISESSGNIHSNYWQASAFMEARRSIGRHSLVYLRGEMRDRSYEELPGSDLTEWSSLIGMRSHVARRLDLDVAIGYGRVDYDDFGSHSRLLGRADIDYAMPRGWELKGSFFQRFSSDAAGADFDETSATLGLAKVFGTRTRASLDLLWTRYRSDTPEADANIATALNFALTRQLTRSLQAKLAYRHWRNGGNNQTDDFHQNRVTLGITYSR